nr:WbqC family protein [Salinibacter altiplanensis]
MIAVQPPEYFPRLEYMAIIQQVDHFVLGNTFPYRQQSFQNRSKLRSPQGWHWITIPVFGNRDGAPMPAVKLKTGGRWREKHWRSFLYNYRTTMYFEHFKATFRPFFEQAWKRLSPCVSRSVELLTELFGLQTPITRASALDGAPETTVDVARVLGAETLLAPSGRVPESLPEGTDLRVVEYDHPTYRQNFEDFEPGMSAADLVFNYGPEARRILAKGCATRADGSFSEQ